MTRTDCLRLALAASLLASCPAVAESSGGAGPISVRDAWATPSTPWDRTSAVYLEIDNGGQSPDTLLRVETTVAQVARVEVDTRDENDFPSTSLMQPLLIPAASRAVLQPGAIHIELIGLAQPLRPGQSFPLRLVLAHAGAVTVTVPVEEAEGAVSTTAPSAVPKG